MDETYSTNELPPSPQFSLGTLMLIVTCIGIGAAAFRGSGDGWDFGDHAVLATLLISAFLTAWWAVRRQFFRMRVAGAAFLFGAFLLLLLPTDRPHPASPASQCKNNLKQIGLALQNYHATYGSFPPAYVSDAKGKPLYSWRVLLLPFLEYGPLASKIRHDEAWDSAANLPVTKMQIPFFQCPSDPATGDAASDSCSYFAVVGPNAAWAGATPRKLAEFKDPSETILVVEVENSGVHWAEPRDLYVGQMAAGLDPAMGQGLSSAHAATVNVLFADGTVAGLIKPGNANSVSALLDIHANHAAAFKQLTGR